MKELDTVFLDFEVELLDCPMRNAFPSRKGKPAMYRFGGGYFSFKAQGQLEDCHYYVYDYRGNNRMVVNGRTNTIYECENNTGSTFVVGKRDNMVQYYHNGSNTISMS